MRSTREAAERDVFLNIPFDKSYEPLFVALVVSLVSLGRIPRCVLEIPEFGDGRLSRIFRLIKSCRASIHDLSSVGIPARFNMPFELGIAFAISRLSRHQFVILEKKRFRLQRTLSDANGLDPGIHNGAVISCVLSNFAKPDANPPPDLIMPLYRTIQKTSAILKRSHGRSRIFSRSIFIALVESASALAKKEGVLEP